MRKWFMFDHVNKSCVGGEKDYTLKHIIIECKMVNQKGYKNKPNREWTIVCELCKSFQSVTFADK